MDRNSDGSPPEPESPIPELPCEGKTPACDRQRELLEMCDSILGGIGATSAEGCDRQRELLEMCDSILRGNGRRLNRRGFPGGWSLSNRWTGSSRASQPGFRFPGGSWFRRPRESGWRRFLDARIRRGDSRSRGGIISI